MCVLLSAQVPNSALMQVRHSCVRGETTMGLLVTLGWVALIVGLVLVVLGYTVAARALRPGWAVTILGVILLLIGYLVPYAVSSTDSDVGAGNGVPTEAL